MTARFDMLSRTVSIFGALMFTAVLFAAATPVLPIA